MVQLPRVSIIAVAALLLAAPSVARTNVRRHATTPPGTILSGVTVAHGATTIYLSGQLAAPIDPAKAQLPPAAMARLTVDDFGDTRTQTISALGRIRAILSAQGFAMGDVVKLTVFLVGDPRLGGRMDFAGMNEGFRTVFGTAETPVTVARSTVQVVALASPAALVEIEAIAAR